MIDELLPIVNHNGEVIGKATRRECHGGSMLLHPVVHLHIIAPDGSLLLQKRSIYKDIQPGRWDTAVGGHVDYGEEVIDALIRESHEELGLTNIKPTFLTKYIFQSDRECELVNVFFVRMDKDTIFNFDHDEIDAVKFWSPSEIMQSIEACCVELTPNFRGEYLKIRNLLK